MDRTHRPLSAREVCEVLREVTWGWRVMTAVGWQSWDDMNASHVIVDVDGWRLSIYNDCGALGYCQTCICPVGRQWSFGSGDRYGTDPVALLSTWEHKTLEGLLKVAGRDCPG